MSSGQLPPTLEKLFPQDEKSAVERVAAADKWTQINAYPEDAVVPAHLLPKAKQSHGTPMVRSDYVEIRGVKFDVQVLGWKGEQGRCICMGNGLAFATVGENVDDAMAQFTDHLESVLKKAGLFPGSTAVTDRRASREFA